MYKHRVNPIIVPLINALSSSIFVAIITFWFWSLVNETGSIMNSVLFNRVLSARQQQWRSDICVQKDLFNQLINSRRFQILFFCPKSPTFIILAQKGYQDWNKFSIQYCIAWKLRKKRATSGKQNSEWYCHVSNSTENFWSC